VGLGEECASLHPKRRIKILWFSIYSDILVVWHSVGITEPIYGPSAIQSVTEQTKHTPYTELTKDDLAWERMDTTNVETKTFYMLSDEGRVGMAQIIYSNVLCVKSR